MDNLKILSINCRGLSDKKKRKDVFDYLRKKKCSIYCLQDTHFTNSELNFIRSQWGYDIYISAGTSESRGVAILFSNNFEYKVLSEKHDQKGNMLILEVEIEKKLTVTLINIYGPNNDSPEFYSELNEIISDSTNEFTILCGDFNLTQDQHLDNYNYNAVNNPKAKLELLKLKDINNLQDPWRVNNPDILRYSWFRRNPTKKARLDFFLISEELSTIVDSITMKPGYRTDHSSVELELKLSEFVKGKGFWKMNNLLLKDLDYVKQVKRTIKNVTEKYAVPIYNFENLDQIPCNEISFTINDQALFEQLLLEIRGMTIPYASKKKKEKLREEDELKISINLLEILTQESPVSEILSELLDEKKTKLQEIRNEKLKGNILRSKAKWIEHGEKPTKYFCSLEKRNYINKTVTKIETDSGQHITEQKMILDEIKHYYQKLYSNKDAKLDDINLDQLLENVNVPKLTDIESQLLEGKISYSELLAAVKQSKNGKSPGTDGYTAEFFKFFWIDLGQFLLRSLNYSLITGELSITQKQGIISIIPKGEKPRQFLKNWRPISLLNITYKLLSSCLANRMQNILDKLINENQKGFLKGRYIGENTRIVYDILHLTEKESIPGLILLVDFEKAFDSVSWKFIYNVLRFFNFGPEFIAWIKILNNDAKLCVIQNGLFSRFFNIGRGCRQGDPISPYLFLLCVEIMGILFRKNTNIKGIVNNNIEYKLCQYADDTAIILDGTENSLKNSLDLLDQFSKYSGLTPNFDKTKAIWIGSKKSSDERLCKNRKLIWSNEPFLLLGITFSTYLQDIPALNYTQKLCEIKNDILKWRKRNLTVMGKITVVKTILLSKLTHLFISLPKPKEEIIKELETMLFHFIWNKQDRISRNQMVQDYKHGGCRMVHISSYIKALKITWIRRLFTQYASWQELLYNLSNTSLLRMSIFGDDYYYKLARRTDNTFWKEVLNNFAELQNKLYCTNKMISQIPIWYNSKIKVQNSTIFYKNWSDRGINFINDIIGEDGLFMSYTELCTKYGFSPPITIYYGLKNALFSVWSTLRNKTVKQTMPFRPISIETILRNNKGSRTMYDIFLLSLKYKCNYITKWKNDLNIDDHTIKGLNCVVFRSTSDVRLRWLQYRITHRILATNKFLHNIGLKDSPLCTFCKKENETLLHLFITCEHVHSLWSKLEEWIYNKVGILLNFSTKDLLFGKPGKKCVSQNIIVYIVKSYIYKQRLNNETLYLTSVKKMLRYYYNLEKYIFYSNCKFQKFSDRWKAIDKLFDDQT